MSAPALFASHEETFALAGRPSSRASAAGLGAACQWSSQRNCSIAPARLLGVFAALCVVSLTIGAAFWAQGMTYVLPFAGLELLAVALALAVYARHAADRERLAIGERSLVVECELGRRVERASFVRDEVCVHAASGQEALIEISCAGRSIAVGRFVRPEARPALADELRAALRNDPRAPQSANIGRES